MPYGFYSIGRMLIVCGSLAVPSFAQTSAPPLPSSQPRASSSAVATPPLLFEVAAIRQDKSGSGSSHSDTSNGRFTATNVSLRSLMQYEAYDIPENRILGAPKWIDSTRFDIEAKMDDSLADHLRTLAQDQRRIQTKALFQQLLADRFKLAVHWETRELPIYALLKAGNKGDKLQPTKDLTVGPSTSSHGSRSGSQLDAKDVTLPELAEALTRLLSRELGRDIIDQTGIEGRYDLTLKWTSDSGPASVPGVADGEASTDLGPSIFTAIREQLGLKLEPAKGSVRVLVVDHAEMPSDN
jgi:uncharacterized protein (TIGR03435 family)